MQSKRDREKILKDFVPESCVKRIIDLQDQYIFQLKICKDRATKIGDYTPPYRGRGHRITINQGLNKYHFLITLIHEIAHLVAFNIHANRVMPHGKEWKQVYKRLMKDFMAGDIFPQDVKEAVANYLVNPGATNCRDEHLARVLKRYDRGAKVIFLEDLKVGDIFSTHTGKIFKKGERQRIRYMCTEVKNKKKYLFSPLAEVIPLNHRYYR